MEFQEGVDKNVDELWELFEMRDQNLAVDMLLQQQNSPIFNTRYVIKQIEDAMPRKMTYDEINSIIFENGMFKDMVKVSK